MCKARILAGALALIRNQIGEYQVLNTVRFGENGGNDGLPSRPDRFACGHCRRGVICRRFVQPVAGLYALLAFTRTADHKRRRPGRLLVPLGPLRRLGLAPVGLLVSSLGLAPAGLLASSLGLATVGLLASSLGLASLGLRLNPSALLTGSPVARSASLAPSPLRRPRRGARNRFGFDLGRNSPQRRKALATMERFSAQARTLSAMANSPRTHSKKVFTRS